VWLVFFGSYLALLFFSVPCQVTCIWCRARRVLVPSGAREPVGQSLGPDVAWLKRVQSIWPAAEWGQLLLQEQWEQRRLVIQIAT